MILKLYPGGSYRNFMKTASKTGSIYEAQNFSILMDILSGLAAIHEAGIAHLDIKVSIFDIFKWK